MVEHESPPLRALIASFLLPEDLCDASAQLLEVLETDGRGEIVVDLRQQDLYASAT